MRRDYPEPINPQELTEHIRRAVAEGLQEERCDSSTDGASSQPNECCDSAVTLTHALAERGD